MSRNSTFSYPGEMKIYIRKRRMIWNDHCSQKFEIPQMSTHKGWANGGIVTEWNTSHYDEMQTAGYGDVGESKLSI